MTNTPTYLACLAACGLWAAAPTSADSAPFDTFKDCDVCPEMIELPMGEFMMGAPEGESRQQFHFYNGKWQRADEENPYIAYHEGPVHRVVIDVPIAMGRNEVTYDEWMACVNDGGCNGYVPDPTKLVLLETGIIEEVIAAGIHPVMRVSYDDALSYIDWLNSKVEAAPYRLPTEAEWEYAARAGTQTRFAQGDWVTPDQVNFNGEVTAENLDDPNLGYINRWMTVPVDQLDAANRWGLRHMSGNLAEITMSCWSDRHTLRPSASMYAAQARDNPLCEYRVRRGGAYSQLMDASRVATRSKIDRETRVQTVGFRILRELNDPN